MPNLLDEIRIASPCPKRWAQLKGDQRVRFCGACSKYVYNLAEMKPAEAARLIRQTEGPICGRLYRRRDGTLIAGDCPKGARRLYRRLVGAFVGAAALVFGPIASSGMQRLFGAEELTGMLAGPVPTVRHAAPLEQAPLASFGDLRRSEQPLQRSR